MSALKLYKGVLVAQRTANNRRYYTQTQLDNFLETESERLELISLKGLTEQQKEIIKNLMTEFNRSNQQTH